MIFVNFLYWMSERKISRSIRHIKKPDTNPKSKVDLKLRSFWVGRLEIQNQKFKKSKSRDEIVCNLINWYYSRYSSVFGVADYESVNRFSKFQDNNVRYETVSNSGVNSYPIFGYVYFLNHVYFNQLNWNHNIFHF